MCPGSVRAASESREQDALDSASSRRLSPMRDHFCSQCGRGPFQSEGDLRRHISRSRDRDHRALRKLLRRRAPVRPAMRPLTPPILEPQLEPMNFEDLDEWFGVEDHSPSSPMCIDGEEDDSEARQTAHADAIAAAKANEPVCDIFESAGARVRRDRPPHATFERAREKSGSPFYPFDSEVDYDFAQWVITENISNSAFDRLMKKDTVRLCPPVYVSTSPRRIPDSQTAWLVLHQRSRSKEDHCQDSLPSTVDEDIAQRPRC